MKDHYCSNCRKPCETYDRNERIADEFGVQVHGPYPHSKCCQEEAWDREQWAASVRRRWERRRKNRACTNNGLHPIFQAILEEWEGRHANVR
jgi:hypothetical protein